MNTAFSSHQAVSGEPPFSSPLPSRGCLASLESAPGAACCQSSPQPSLSPSQRPPAPLPALLTFALRHRRDTQPLRELLLQGCGLLSATGEGSDWRERKGGRVTPSSRLLTRHLWLSLLFPHCPIEHRPSITSPWAVSFHLTSGNCHPLSKGSRHFCCQHPAAAHGDSSAHWLTRPSRDDLAHKARAACDPPEQCLVATATQGFVSGVCPCTEHLMSGPLSCCEAEGVGLGHPWSECYTKELKGESKQM